MKVPDVTIAWIGDPELIAEILMPISRITLRPRAGMPLHIEPF